MAMVADGEIAGSPAQRLPMLLGTAPVHHQEVMLASGASHYRIIRTMLFSLFLPRIKQHLVEGIHLIPIKIESSYFRVRQVAIDLMNIIPKTGE